MLHLRTDEDFNGNVVTGIRHSYPQIDLLRIQEVGLSGHEDPDVLAWAADQGRIVLTNDRRTMPAFATERIAAGLSMPGLFVLRKRTSITTRLRRCHGGAGQRPPGLGKANRVAAVVNC